MIPGVVASQQSGMASPAQFLVLPLTYDEEDHLGEMTWTRAGGDGPHVTPAGFEGDGYEARLKSTTVPTWMQGATSKIGMQASVRIHSGRLKTAAGETALHLGADASGASPTLKLALKVLQDQQNTSRVYLGLQGFTTALQTLALARPEWIYRGRFPQLVANGYAARPQALIFLDNNTLLVAGHFEDTETRAYRIDIATGAVTGAFTFGASYRHVASFARNSVGEIWAVDYDTGRTIRIDVIASLATGFAVITADWNTSILSRVSGIEFISVDGAEYVLLAEYATTGTPYLYVIAANQMASGSVFNVANRYKRFSIGPRSQGVALNGTALWVSKNRDVAGVTYGWMERYSGIASAIASSADGAILSPDYSASGPSQYVEDIKIHPQTGELWTMTEGWGSVGDLDGFLGIWSSPADGSVVENHVAAFYDGAGGLTVRLNGREFQSVSWPLNQAVAVVSVGGPPQASAGMQTGYFTGYIRNIRFQNAEIQPAEYTATVAGTTYEPNSLTTYALTVTNPGAESGTAGWINEVGSIATRAANPTAFEGVNYFSGGSNAQTIARQRLDILAQTGLTVAQVDAGNIWAKIRWRQASFTNQDPCTMGIRTLNASQVQQSLKYGGLAFVPYGDSGSTPNWYPRCLPASIPSGGRYVDAIYRSDRNSGTNNDGYIDDVSVTVYRR